MAKRRCIDQMGRALEFEHTPRRLVSLVPSITEFMYDLVPESHVLGTTNFCVHPRGKIDSSIRIGGTKNVKTDRVRSLKPDLIIGSKEENVREQVEDLAKDIPVWMTDVKDIKEALEMMQQLGDVLDNKQVAASITHEIAGGMNKLPEVKKRVLYLIWRKPFMAAGNDTFIHDMLLHLQMDNVIQSPRYPALKPVDIQHLQPELILLSSEPYPFSEKHIPELKQLCPHAEVRLTNGEMYSWYGSRMRLAPAYFREFFGA
jgi:ABC-type Fe3+-hydroxamate transport system substrate-binding protein